MVKIISGYIPTMDITVIFEDTYNSNDDLIKQELKGFYYGQPNEQYDKEFYNDLVATFTSENNATEQLKLDLD